MLHHFTYAENDAAYSDLCQGDILKKTPELMDVLKKFHPYFYTNEEYMYFIVLTQTCELARREGKPCRSPYITIAAVRSFESVIYRYAIMNDVKHFGRFFMLSEYQADKIKEFVERLLNNNEPEYFFLADDVSRNFSDAMVATLLVSVAIKSEKHYLECLNARTFSLKDTFKAKLGWLVGQLYSKVGTPDWGSTGNQQEYDRLVSDTLISIPAVNKK